MKYYFNDLLQLTLTQKETSQRPKWCFQVCVALKHNRYWWAIVIYPRNFCHAVWMHVQAANKNYY